MCDKAVREDPSSLNYVDNWFVAQQRVKLWDDYCNRYYGDKLTEWYDSYQKRRAQKAQIKKELLSIAWHPDRVMDWCVPEDERKLWK